MNHRNFSKATEAVSPVVATLLLVLVAAGAAIGFGVFLNGFQKNTQSKVSGEAPAETLHIGGSSTVFELTEKVIPAWNAAHPSIKIDDQEGGSGAGKQAICRGLLDLGASSSAVAVSGSPGQDLATCPDVNGDGVKDAGKDLVQTVVGYDAVVLAYNAASTDCTTGPLDLTAAQIKELYLVNGAGQAATAGLGFNAGAPSAAGKYAWADLPGCAAGSSASAVVLGSRSDPAGTEDGFCSKFLSNNNVQCTSATHQMVDTFFTSVNPQQGNDGIRTWLKATAHSMSFIGYGSVAESGSGLVASKMQGFAPTASAIKAAGVTACAPAATDATHFCAARPLEYISVGAPSATAQLFLDFITQTLNNQNFNTAAGYVSIYA